MENGGRINYGGQLPDNRKGITESVTLGGRGLTGWEMYNTTSLNKSEQSLVVS